MLHSRYLFRVALDSLFGFLQIVVVFLCFSSSSSGVSCQIFNNAAAVVSSLDDKHLCTLLFLIGDSFSSYLNGAPPHSRVGSLHQFLVKFGAPRSSGADVSNIGEILPMQALICIVLAKC